MHTANVTLDLKGLTCPGPILGAKRIVDELESGQILQLISDCPGTKDDLYAWVKQTGNTILEAEKLPGGGMAYYIQKGQATQNRANVTLDMRGAICPGPIVEAKKLLNGMKEGDILKLVSNCPGTKSDITSWAASTRMELVNTVEIAPGEYEFYVKKAGE
jgi:TusA-related sulfurtransferase